MAPTQVPQQEGEGEGHMCSCCRGNCEGGGGVSFLLPLTGPCNPGWPGASWARRRGRERCKSPPPLHLR